MYFYSRYSKDGNPENDVLYGPFSTQLEAKEYSDLGKETNHWDVYISDYRILGTRTPQYDVKQFCDNHPDLVKELMALVLEGLYGKGKKFSFSYIRSDVEDMIDVYKDN